MGKVRAGITISVDGFITGPGDGPGCGLGAGGERLHYWVFGGPWSYDSPGRGEPVGVDKAWLEETMAAADGKDVHVMGGADLIRQALAAGLVDELSIVIAPVTLGAGKRLFDGFGESLELEHLGVRQSPFATFIDYRVKK
jgi:hypothetical protein